MSLEDAFKKASKKNEKLAQTVAIAQKLSKESTKWERAEAEVKRKWARADKMKSIHKTQKPEVVAKETTK